MQLLLLGPVEASVEGRALQLGAAKQRAVLAMLALRPGRPVSADELMEGLWGEHPPATAAKMVQQYISHLRRVLDAGPAVVTRGRGYELRIAPDEVDALPLRASDRRGRARARRSRSGADRRWPTSRTSRSPRPRSGGWRSSGSPPPKR